MIGEMKEIYCGIYGGWKKTDVRDLVTVSCDRYDKCSLYQKGKCACISTLFAPYCPYGKPRRSRGYSERARKYYEWEKEITSRDSYRAKERALSFVATVGEIMMTDLYCGIFYNEDKSRWDGPMLSTHMTCLPIQDVTPDMLKKLYDYVPYSIIGDVIKGYKADRDKWFTKLSEELPQIYQGFIEKYPDCGTVKNHVGRFAYVSTLVDGITFKDSGAWWTLDKANNKLFCKNYLPAFTTSGICGDNSQKCYLECALTPQMIVKVEKEEWCDENTVYK